MNILDKIIAAKKIEVAQRRQQKSMADLRKDVFFNKEPLSLKQFLLDENKTGIIAEFKRKSPSKGIINDKATVADVTKSYAENGASGISVLTDELFFGGTLQDLSNATISKVPLLRKDFMIDAYQLFEAKAFGADVILLIAACLQPAEVKELAKVAKDLGLEVLLELHDASELQHICEDVDLVGINNRNLKTFAVDLEHSVTLAEKIDNRFIKVAESGISDVNNIRFLKQYGFKGFLIGENFMKEEDPGAAFQHFVTQLKTTAV